MEPRIVLTLPVAVADFYDTIEDQQIIIAAPGVLANDTDAEADALDAVLVDNVDNGSLFLNTDGNFEYTPNPGFSGTDTFTYKAVTAARGFIVDPAVSTVRLSATLDTADFGSDSDFADSHVAGTIKAKLTPDNSPFLQIHVRDMDVSLIDAIDLNFSFAFGFAGLDVHADPGAISLSMESPGPEVGVSGTSWVQPDNSIRLQGVVNLDATGLAEGQIEEGPMPFDTITIQPLNGTIVQADANLTLTVPVDVTQVIEQDGNTITAHIEGTLIARGTAGPSEESNTVTVTITVEPHLVAVDDAYRVAEDGLLVASVSPADAREEVLVPKLSIWKFLDNGSNQGTAWQAVGFNDATWASGPGELGYGDGDEGTVVGFGGNAAAKHVTTYFRRAFTLTNIQDIYNLGIDVKRDDGVAVYINGVQVARDNLAEGAAFNTLALGNAPDEVTYFSFDALPSMLVEGTNVISAEIHQVLPDSSDISFDLQLRAQRATRSVLANEVDIEGHSLVAEIVTGPTNGDLTLDADGSFEYEPFDNFVGTDSFTYRAREQFIIERGSDWRYLDNGTDQGTFWQSEFFDDTSWAVGAAELGYGDGDEETVVGFGGNAANKFITTYFRHTFDVTGAAALGDLRLSVIRDDGVAVYLNGEFLDRDNLSASAIFSTLADGAIGGAGESTPVEFIVPNSRLREGSNIIAVEIHQAAVDSTDISFDLWLAPKGRPDTATATIIVEPRNDAPLADADGPYSTAPGVPLNVSAASGVLAGDTDQENAALRAVLVSGPSNGTFNLAADGSFAWTPAVAGPTSFTYRAAEQSPTSLVGFGSTWRIGDDGADLGTAWRGTGFDDSSFWVGPGELGYGDGDEETLVRFRDTDTTTAGVQKNITTYFRHTFHIDDASKLIDLAGQFRVDDGASVYLNGSRVTSYKLAVDAAFNVVANSASENDLVSFTADASLLVDGPNVLAVEVHQQGNGSSDVTFDLEIHGTLLSDPITVPLDAASLNSSVSARHVFYNQSAWDGNSAAINVTDNAAIATDKSALLPGGTGTFANYTSYDKGINGLMIDLAGTHGTITDADFAFKTGNANNTATWTPLATVPTVDVRVGGGVAGSDRITLTFPTNTARKTWLQVRVLANANTNLAADDVFYFGNAVGEVGDTTANALVNATDEIQIRANPRNIVNPAPVDFKYDIDRNKLVNATDQILARSNTTNIVTALRLIVPTASPAAEGLADAALAGLANDVEDILANRRKK